MPGRVMRGSMALPCESRIQSSSCIWPWLLVFAHGPFEGTMSVHEMQSPACGSVPAFFPDVLVYVSVAKMSGAGCAVMVHCCASAALQRKSEHVASARASTPWRGELQRGWAAPCCCCILPGLVWWPRRIRSARSANF